MVNSEQIDGFTVHTLENSQCSVSMVEELGGRLVSLRDNTGDREWLDGWQPKGARRLGYPGDPTDFSTGSFAGADECLPTVLSCQHEGVDIPDHGDLWTQCVRADKAGLERELLQVSWKLNSFPLLFTRSIRQEGNAFRIDYALENLSESAVPFLWAWHPLFTIEAGDRIGITDRPDSCRTPEGDILPWPEASPGQDLATADLKGAPVPCAKVFLGPLQQGLATIQGRTSALSMSWPADLFPWAGIWISRGFSQGHHHWAIEPTNAPVDRLSEIGSHTPPTLLRKREIRNWELVISLGLSSSK